MHGVVDRQEDFASVRKYFLETWEKKVTDHEFLMMGVYLNTFKGFVPRK
jgi:hypothetical protein